MEAGEVMRAGVLALGLGEGRERDIAFSFWAEPFEDEEERGGVAALGGFFAGSLLVTRFAVEEVIFGLPRIEIELISKYADIELERLIDRPASLTIHHKYLEHLRHFSGIIVEASQGNSSHHRTSYRLLLQPSLCRLDYGSDCRIFQSQTVPEIVETLLEEHGIEDVSWKLAYEHESREYCVQYRETHLAFIERILAEEGIFYYFRHGERGKCALVMSDNPDDLPDCQGQAQLEYHGQASTVHYGVYCSSVERRRKLRSTAYRQRDYSFKNPAYHQQHRQDAAQQSEQGDYELYEYPGRYKRAHVGESFTRNRLEAMRVDSELISCRANAPLLMVGHGFTLTDHPDNGLNCKWRLLTIRHEGTQPQALEEEAQGVQGAQGIQGEEEGVTTGHLPLAAPPLKGSDFVGLTYGISRSVSSVSRANLLTDARDKQPDVCHYACAFTAQDARQPYRPPQMRKPHVDGPQMAHIVGPEGEEIYTDEFGRVKVHFPWDWRKDPQAEDSSCWIRVASNWAGARWGHIAIPRIGQEVIVEFLEGDPDQPIITGRTYHAVNQPPYKLPHQKTRMVIRSDTYKGRGFNELSFEDENGKEEVFLRAQKDMNVEVLNDRREQINRDQFQHIIRDTVAHIGGDEEHVVAGNVSIAVGNNKLSQYLLSRTNVLFGRLGSLAKYLRLPDVFNLGKGNYQLFVEKNKSEVVNAASSEVVGLVKSTIVGNIQQTTVGRKKSLIVRGRYDADIGRVHNLNIGNQYNIRVGPHIEITMSKEGELCFKAKKIKFSAEKIDMN